MLEEHKKFISTGLVKSLIEKKFINKKVTIFTLKDPTPSQPATIVSYLRTINNDFPFFIKDCDNYFKIEPKVENSVAYINLGSLREIDAASKSYIKINQFNEIELIAEKTIISDKFCCGGYSFISSHSFSNSYESIGGDNNHDLYVSHIIQKNLLEGITYHAHEASSYEDYGTLREFKNYTKEVKTIFSDFDGVLVLNSSKFANPPWQYNPNKNNLNYLSNFLKGSPDSKLIITTSRPISEKKNIENFLKNYGIYCHDIVTDLPHAKRILINDYSSSNPYPSASSINIKRDSDNLCDFLK